MLKFHQYNRDTYGKKVSNLIGSRCTFCFHSQSNQTKLNQKSFSRDNASPLNIFYSFLIIYIYIFFFFSILSSFVQNLMSNRHRLYSCLLIQYILIFYSLFDMSCLPICLTYWIIMIINYSQTI